MSTISDVVVIIPAYNPDDKFIRFLNDLKENGYERIIVIDDGSKEETQHYFDAAEHDYNVYVVKHAVNLGQGRAYKTGFNHYLNNFKDTIGVIQCDCDGQHNVDDIIRCTSLLRENPDSFLIGIRDFSSKDVPLRSRLGNRITSFVFKCCVGLDIDDTQTGLKGIPYKVVNNLMQTPGERFEYASSCLLEIKKQGTDIVQFPIKTIYINGNETSHFSPVFDSIRIYMILLKYIASSISAFMVDILLFSGFVYLLMDLFPAQYIIISTYLAKVFSCTYSFFVNRKFVFHSDNNRSGASVRFILLCIVQASCSGMFTKGIVYLTKWSEVLSKIMVDTLLFFVSYQIQNRWVFTKRNVSLKNN